LTIINGGRIVNGILIKQGMQMETKTTSIKVYGQTAINLRELSSKRKSERNPVRTQGDIVEQFINQAHKEECKQC